MVSGKRLERIAVIATALMLALTAILMVVSSSGLVVSARTMGYEDRLFDNSKVHTIDIVADDWDELIANAADEEYITADLVIDGEAYQNVAIRAKGNTSLSNVASMGSERYSLKVEFDHYNEGETYHGLDKLCLNNLIQDATMMKDYLVYTMMNEFGVDAPLCSYVYITVNGEDWGLYLAVEGIEESFLERNYGSNYGDLYKPDTMSGGGGMNSSDVKLQYIDDDPDSYSNIWDSAKTDVTDADQARLIESLESLSNNEDIESVVDVDEVLRYFVVHNYVCNGDSYTGSMVHNYYLYEEDGQMSMIPWDYNLAFGTFQGSNATSTINTPIDSPVDGGSGEDRPMWNWIVSSEEYTALYHQYYAEFLASVDIESIIDNAYNLIKDDVAIDPTAFYTQEEFEAGVATLRQFCELRSKSISLQLENEATTEDMNYVDASAITLSDMGDFGGGGGDDHGGPQGGPEQGGDNHGGPEDNDGHGGPQGGPGGQQPPSGDFSPDMDGMPGEDRTSTDRTAWIQVGASAAILVVGLIIAKVYRHY